MIAIKYSGKTLNKYDAFCKRLQTKIGKWLVLGYVGNSKSKDTMDVLTRSFFNVLNIPTAIKKLANLPAPLLPKVIDIVENHFPQLKTDRLAKEANPKAPVCDLYKCIYRAFSNYGYDSDSFPSEELMNDLDIAVCPYCNRNFVKSIQVKQNAAGKDIFVKGQLDHFYPRSLYPYLAICKHNLVPSCPSCNGASGKHDDNTRTKGVVNPYLLKDSSGMKFQMAITGKGFADLQQIGKAITIDLDCSAYPDLANNEAIFHLKKIYAEHTDYAAEVYYKSILRSPKSYMKFIGDKMATQGVAFNQDDYERILLGVYTNDKDFHKRPLSKFCADIARQRKLIP